MVTETLIDGNLLLAVLFAALITYLIDRMKRYRALKRDKALNALYPHSEPRKKHVTRTNADDANSETNFEIASAFRYIGSVDKLPEISKEGDFVEHNRYSYVYHNGWVLIGRL